ncbi:MAG: hypothetical protein D6692_09150 [Planctomycetota bacterium]|nr:MAG: hypothetical protein D6692_09150 [Planctomycetota bacterium]
MIKRVLLASAAALVGVQGSALAADDALAIALSNAEMESLASSMNNAGSLSLGVQMQFRYQFNSRDDASITLANPDDDLSVGFVMRRAKVEAKGDITDSMKGKAVFAFNRTNGTAVLEDLYADWAVNDTLTLRIGQFKLPVLREESISSKYQLAPERSAMNETFNQDRSQGVQAMFGGDNWRGMVAFSDGANSDNTVFTSSAEADYALTGRFDFKFGEASFKQFDQFTSFRGAAGGSVLGAAFHWQTMGDTNPSAPTSTDMMLATVDYQLVADGWNLFVAGVWSNTDTGATDFDDFGLIAQGGIFVSDQTELFARWDSVLPDDDRGATGEDFNTVTFGVNYYFVPESHAAKFTLGLSWYLDDTTSSIVSTSDGHNLLPDSEDGQFGITAQAQLLF